MLRTLEHALIWSRFLSALLKFPNLKQSLWQKTYPESQYKLKDVYSINRNSVKVVAGDDNVICLCLAQIVWNECPSVHVPHVAGTQAGVHTNQRILLKLAMFFYFTRICITLLQVLYFLQLIKFFTTDLKNARTFTRLLWMQDTVWARRILCCPVITANGYSLLFGDNLIQHLLHFTYAAHLHLVILLNLFT